MSKFNFLVSKQFKLFRKSAKRVLKSILEN